MDYALPNWFRKELGPVRQPRVIWSDSKHFIVAEDGRSDRVFLSMAEALDAVDHKNYIIDASIESTPMVSNDAIVLQWKEEQFQKFLEARREYLISPSSIFEAYRFADAHPALWTYDPSRRNEPIETAGWFIARCVPKLMIEPTKVGGETVFNAKLGFGNTPLQQNVHFCEAGTYEDLIVSLAALLEEEFYPNGVERRMMLPSTFAFEAEAFAETVRRKGLAESY